MYLNFVAIDGIIKNQINTQQDATPKGVSSMRFIHSTEFVESMLCLISPSK
jgi:hypothetical protein